MQISFQFELIQILWHVLRRNLGASVLMPPEKSNLKREREGERIGRRKEEGGRRKEEGGRKKEEGRKGRT